MNFLQVLSVFLASSLGTPYYWGGNNTVEGYDCSGFVLEPLNMFGVGPQYDTTAHGIYDYFIDHPAEIENFKPGLGALVFYGKKSKGQQINFITHVGFMINAHQVAEAGGGDKRVLSLMEARSKNAMVRIRPYDRRSDIVFILTPKYPAWTGWKPSYPEKIIENKTASGQWELPWYY